MKTLTVMPALLISYAAAAIAADMSRGADNFYASDKVTAQKVYFKNQYKMNVAGTLFLPKDLAPGAKRPAIVVGPPIGAVKEQSSNLYAQKLADQGFVTLSLDLSFWGESEGQPRNSVLPDVYAEDFSAAVDFLGTRPFVDRNQIGARGICGRRFRNRPAFASLMRSCNDWQPMICAFPSARNCSFVQLITGRLKSRPGTVPTQFVPVHKERTSRPSETRCSHTCSSANSVRLNSESANTTAVRVRGNLRGSANAIRNETCTCGPS